MGTTSALARTVSVVWPPVWNAFDTHIAVPALCGYLAEHGVSVRQFDLNIDFYRYLVAEDTIEEQVRLLSPHLPRKVGNAVDFARRYYQVLRSPLVSGFRQRFSEDAEKLLLTHALTIFNHAHPDTVFNTLGVYLNADIEDSDILADLAERDAGNPFATFYHRSFLPRLAESPPSIVGISVCGSFQLAAAFTLCRMIKKVDPDICVVIGGAFFSTVPDALLNPKTAANLFRHVDAFILNEGEIPFFRLVHQVFQGMGSLTGPNVQLRGQSRLTNEPLLCLPAAKIALPVFPDGAIESYFRVPAPRLPVEVSRGCYWGRCTFCNLASGANERYRGVPIDRIVHALAALTDRYHSTSIAFSTLAMSPNILRRLCTRLHDDQIPISWSAWIRPERTLTEEDIDSFATSGCESLAVTPESFNTKTLARMDKGFDLEHVIRIVRHIQQVGLCDGINIIAGFPGETVEDFVDTVEICRDLGVRGEFFPFSLLKNSTVYRAADDYGIAVRERPEKDLAVSVPFDYVRDRAAPDGIEMIRMAARQFPGRIFAEDPMAGFTFDFSGG
jgi:anaerobic magnesium-protoporphyrin IX monomethyl ester cyclase